MNKIDDQNSYLQLLYEVFLYRRFDLNEYSDMDKDYYKILMGVIHFLNGTNIDLFYEDDNGYYTFQMDLSNLDYSFSNVEKNFLNGLMCFFLYLQSGFSVSKKQVEEWCNCNISSSVFNRIKKQIECVTSEKIKTTKDLKYYLTKENLDEDY